MVVVCIWAEPTEDLTFLKMTGVVAVLAFSLAHMCLLFRVPGGPVLTWLFRATLVCVGAVAAMWSAAIVLEPTDDFFLPGFRCAGSSGRQRFASAADRG